MSKLSLHVLRAQVLHATHLNPVGSTFRHNGSGDVYEITGYGIQEATQKVQVFYQRAFLENEARCVGDDLPIWSRDHDKFFAYVEDFDPVEGIVLVPRFQRVAPNPLLGWEEVTLTDTDIST